GSCTRYGTAAVLIRTGQCYSAWHDTVSAGRSASAPSEAHDVTNSGPGPRNRPSIPRHLQHRGPLQRPAAQPLDGEIRLSERKALHGGGEAHARGEREELLSVGAGEIRDRGHRA